MKRDIREAILHLCSQKKEFPTMQELAQHTGQTISSLRVQLDKLCERRFIEKLPDGGFMLNPFAVGKMQDAPRKLTPVEQLNIPYYEPASEEIMEAVPYTQEPPKRTTFSKVKSFTKQIKEKDYVMPLIRTGMFFIGIGAAIISTYYTSIWLIEFLPLALALLLSGIMVSFSVLSFEVIIIFVSNQTTKHWSKWPIVTGFLILWIIVSAFSITSTVAGQVNAHTKNKKEFAEKNESKKTDVVKWGHIQERKSELLSRRDEKQKQISNLIQITNQVATIQDTERHGNALTNANYRISQAEKSLDSIEAELAKVREEEKNVLAINSSAGDEDAGDYPDFYSWLAKVLKINKDFAQFLMTLFPAIFVDIISPSALAIAFFMRKGAKD